MCGSLKTIGWLMKLDVPVIGILRGIDASFFKDLLPVSFAAGLTALEITMNTEGAEDIVRECRSLVPVGKMLGMGTIRTLDEAERAIAAGAMFLVSPNYDRSVIEYARRKDVPIVAGAFTPSEVYAAWSAGAAMVKIFPCGAVGPGYIKELLGPFDDIPLVAVGGVNRDNLAQYFAAGAAAIGVGTSLFGKEALANQDLGTLAINVGDYISCVRAAVRNT